MADRSAFISYRRQLSETLALLIRNDLAEHNFDIFMDLENLDSGEFERTILSQIEAREHFIVLLQPGSLDQIGEPGDWLRREIAHALAHGRNVVPVTASGFEFRRDLVLPPDVARLPSFNAVLIQPGYFDAAMERLRTRFLKMSPKAREEVDRQAREEEARQAREEARQAREEEARQSLGADLRSAAIRATPTPTVKSSGDQPEWTANLTSSYASTRHIVITLSHESHTLDIAASDVRPSIMLDGTAVARKNFGIGYKNFGSGYRKQTFSIPRKQTFSIPDGRELRKAEVWCDSEITKLKIIVDGRVLYEEGCADTGVWVPS